MDKPQSLTVKFKFRNEDLERIDQLEENLENAISYRNVGKYEGYELNNTQDTGVFIMSAADGNQLYKTIRPILQESDFLQEIRIEVTSGSVEEGTLEVIEYPV